MSKKIVIVGGGFGGARTALDLTKHLSREEAKITLISNKYHFEYYPALYRVVTGKSPLEVCIPLNEIFTDRKIEIVIDKITGVDTDKKSVKGESGSNYSYDYLVLALGSETAYFGVPGLPEFAYGFKSINEALKLKNHLHELFEKHINEPKEETVSKLHILVVGGGATGVEVSGELVKYLKMLAQNHKIDPSFVTIDLIEAAGRILPAMPEEVSAKVFKRLHNLGVNIYLNRTVVKEDVEQVFLKDMAMKSKTVIWTAGTRPHHLYNEIRGLEYQKNGRVIVDAHLQPRSLTSVFIIGDAAATPYSGLAQTALYDGSFVARNIVAEIRSRSLASYNPKKTSYVIPVGKGWAAMGFKGLQLYGWLAYQLRELIDLKFFCSILSFRKALTAFQSRKKLCESCETCLPASGGPS